MADSSPGDSSPSDSSTNDSSTNDSSTNGSAPVCSGKGCRAPGVWALVWNNPKIHPPDRRKVWLACDDHREHLTTFLAARSFLRTVVPIGDLDEADAPR